MVTPALALIARCIIYRALSCPTPPSIRRAGSTAYIHVRECADIFIACARLSPGVLPGAHVYTVGGDTVDTTTFIQLLDKVRSHAVAPTLCHL